VTGTVDPGAGGRDIAFMQSALAQARAARDAGEVPVGAMR
jgi:tRNA(Arg) A34 adenosine deaminase TadA